MTFRGFPDYWGAIAVTKCLAAILFAFLPGKDRDKVTLNACTGWVRHMGRFYENRTYTFVLDATLSEGEAEVLLLDQRKQLLLKVNRHVPSQSIYLEAKTSRYYLQWQFQSASGKCELCW